MPLGRSHAEGLDRETSLEEGGGIGGIEAAKVYVKELVEKSEVVGRVLPFSSHRVDEISIVLKEKKLPFSSYVFVLDDDGLPIIYQVVGFRDGLSDYNLEKRLIALGMPLKDDRTLICSGVLAGKLYEDGRIGLPKCPVTPLAEVRLCTPELVRLIIEPEEEPKVRIGVNPLTSQPVYIKLRPLIKQGLLINGASGTGKTTALLTLITRSLEACGDLHFIILDWTGEFRSLAQSDYAKKFRVNVLAWDKFISGLKMEDPMFLLSLLEKEDPRVKGALKRLIYASLVLCKEDKLYPTKRNTKAKLLGKVARRAILDEVRDIIDKSAYIPDDVPEDVWDKERLIEEVEKDNVLIIDFTRSEDLSTPDEVKVKRRVAAFLAKCLWDELSQGRKLTCVIVSDEARRIAPAKFYERIYGRTDTIWITLAREGGKKGCSLWLATRRLDLLNRAVRAELQQNFICFNIEDVDKGRAKRRIGEAFASLLTTLPPGEAIVKSATGFKTPRQVVHVKFDLVLQPLTEYKLEERFKPRI
jgi:hypothetical protein